MKTSSPLPSICTGLFARAVGSIRPMLLTLVFLTLLVMNGAAAAALRTAVIGDSLSAEYDALPDIPGVEDPTAYAAITVPGWESRCWVEVLGLLSTNSMDFGPQETTLPGWNDLRFTGYKYNFAIPGFEASQYEDIVNSSLISNPQYLLFKPTLADTLAHDVDACVVWIGANEFRANYGFLYDGGDPTALVQNLNHDIGEILDFVQAQSSSLHVVVVNLPDLGATPTKQAAHPDPAKRERVTQATMLANQAISELATARGLPVADVFTATHQLIEGQPFWFGPVDLFPGSDPDNNPRYTFTRDGLHPNTGLQIHISRIIVSAFNDHYGTAIPLISDTAALGLLGINPQQPYLDWAATNTLAASGMGDDPDRDGLVNLAEFSFGLDPNVPSPSPITFATSPTGVTASYQPDPAHAQMVNLTPQWSANLTTWTNVPAASLSQTTDGRVTVQFPAENPAGFLRLLITIRTVE